MTEFILVHTSLDSQNAAQQLADAVVAKRLAACCWVSGPIQSTYWWKGNIEHAQEWVCQFKTRKHLYPALERFLKEAHSYEEPEIIAIPLTTGSQGYLDWVVHETQTAEADGN